MFTLSRQVEPVDVDTEQNNTFDDKTSNVISSDDIPVAAVEEVSKALCSYFILLTVCRCFLSMMYFQQRCVVRIFLWDSDPKKSRLLLQL